MTRFSRPARWAALAALAATAALAQFAVIDVGAIAKAVEQVQAMAQQLQQISAFRQQIDAQVAAIVQPFQDLVVEAQDLAGEAISLPAQMGAVPQLGARLTSRLAATPGNPYLQPPTPTPAQLIAAVTPTASDDPLVPDPGRSRDRALLVHRPQQDRLDASAAAAHEQNVAEARAVSTGVNVLTAADTALTGGEAAASEQSWTAIFTRQAATLHTLTALQSKALELEVTSRERELLQRQAAVAERGTDRVALLQAAADFAAAHAARLADPNRDAGDELLENCGGRLFTAGCGDVDPAYN